MTRLGHDGAGRPFQRSCQIAADQHVLHEYDRVTTHRRRQPETKIITILLKRRLPTSGEFPRGEGDQLDPRSEGPVPLK